MDSIGAEVIHRKIDTDPTGLPFVSVMALALHGNKPMSALVNAGAIFDRSKISATGTVERWAKILAAHGAFVGRRLALSDEINASEQSANAHDRGFASLLESSGGRAYTVGLPRKSGVGGVLLGLVHRVLGMAVLSPPFAALQPISLRSR